MKQKRPISGLKTAGTNIVKKTDSKNLLLTNDAQKTPGTGLWCVNIGNTNINRDRDNYYDELKNNNNPNFELELETEKKRVIQLKFQIQDLSMKLHQALKSCAEAEYNSQRANNNTQTYFDKIEQQSNQIKDYEEKIDSYENTLINMNEALSNAKKEISRLKSENNSLSQKQNEYYSMYQNMLIDKERKEASMSSDITNLMLKLQMTNSEKDNMMKLVNKQQSSNTESSFLQKQLDDKINTIQNNETIINKLIYENTDLKRKLASEEGFKNKFSDIIKKKKEKIQNLKEELKSYKEAIGGYTNEVKYNQEMVMQRDNQIKIYKDKIKKLEEDINILNNNLKKEQNKNKKKVEFEPQIQDEIVQVKARPLLFGPEIDEI